MKFWVLLLLSLIVLPAEASQIYHTPLELPHDGIIRFYIYHVDEVASIRYLDDQGKWIPESYDKISKMLRSREDDQTIEIDKRLIELADHLQDHFGVDTIEVISGFRSRAFNKNLKEAGRNVANESFHTKGLAMDIHIDEIKEATLRDYLLSLKLGGVGYYGNILMVHMDFGPIREWNGGDYKENLGIGIFNEESSATFTTHKLFYDLNSQMMIHVKGIVGQINLVLHKFYRGQWQEIVDSRIEIDASKINKVSIQELMKSLKNLSPYGKFRFQYKKGSEWQNSNEFYVKKK